MITRWEQLQNMLPIYYDVIDAGISKLTEYYDRLATIPAYTLSICEFFRPLTLLLFLTVELVLNPLMKLNWFKKHMPGSVEEVRELFYEQVC